MISRGKSKNSLFLQFLSTTPLGNSRITNPQHLNKTLYSQVFRSFGRKFAFLFQPGRTEVTVENCILQGLLNKGPHPKTLNPKTPKLYAINPSTYVTQDLQVAASVLSSSEWKKRSLCGTNPRSFSEIPFSPIGVMLGLYLGNAKENGNYHIILGLYRGVILRYGKIEWKLLLRA